GSGLSHFNLASPEFFTGLLRHMKNSHAFKNSLPTAGEGSLYQFNSNLFPGKTLMAKSGSMTRVRCYSGYLATDNNNQLAFSVMFNHFEGEHTKLIAEIEKLLAAIRAFY
ncbi:MAG: D-alanyl-D-alanine carboxypeptidase, partial [Tangfeifania sp.]